MPRKIFLQDLAHITSELKSFPGLQTIQSDLDDGSISLTYKSPGTGLTVDITVLVPDLSEYPEEHQYMIFTTSDNVPPAVATALVAAQRSFAGSSMHDLLTSLGTIIDDAYSDQTDATSQGESDDYDMSNDFMDWQEPFDDDDHVAAPVTPDGPSSRCRLRSDLRAARILGYRIGHHDEASHTEIYMISCRIGRLGISEEAMQAWGIRASQYLMLLIRYPLEYQCLEDILQALPAERKARVQMRVGLCDSYKSNSTSAARAFQDSASSQRNDSAKETRSCTLELLFIGKPLEGLLNERFIDIISYRVKYGFSWGGAELYFNDSQGKMLSADGNASGKYTEPDDWASTAPSFLTADPLATAKLPSKLSFPLLAMQFTLRHFVRCTEFCLLCHCKIDAKFEALKPYVCSKGLCLYQYMALGFGPSTEWEILSQPYVVDMLVCFAYARASAGRLEDLPGGLGLKVPVLEEKDDPVSYEVRQVDSFRGLLTARIMELQLKEVMPLRAGDWVVIVKRETGQNARVSQQWHCRVQDRVGEVYVQLSNPLSNGEKTLLEEIPLPRSPVEFFVYDRNFDTLNDWAKRKAIVTLLDILPRIDEIRALLLSCPSGASFIALKNRSQLPPAALDVLRWIVASNRSCIMQNFAPEHLVSGMHGYVQFRLAQGAPDKEQRFVEAVEATAARLNLQHPTIFAWHGSTLHNWTGILREGLHFRDMAHGRAYGHGVYMSPDFNTSLGYSGTYVRSNIPGVPGLMWPKSALQILGAISLIEVVNAPNEFVSKSPHYVVNKLDWLQPRYLFVKCANPPSETSENENHDFTPATGPAPAIYEQDPNCPVKGPTGSVLGIPMSVFSARRRQKLRDAKEVNRKRNNDSQKSEYEAEKEAKTDVWTGEDSEPSDAEDLQLLGSDTEEDRHENGGEGDHLPYSALDEYQTDFRPGTLDGSSLQLFSPPRYATSEATRILQQQLKDTLKVQKTHPLHELGWYIDPNLINTVYQWIVELHSFDETLVLAKELKQIGNTTSVVLEVRFPPSFPHSPPFVRVIRPRFQTFQQGGGGHVTAGGAMCMELLTNSGWLPATSMESVLLSVRVALTSTDPRPARLESRACQRDYHVGEAIQAYKRACIMHGWPIPDDIEKMSWDVGA